MSTPGRGFVSGASLGHRLGLAQKKMPQPFQAAALKLTSQHTKSPYL